MSRAVDGILLLDKPGGVSSNTALQTVKRIYQAAKAGHTGSLDPLATGLLPICFGQATKLSGFLLDGDKRYRVRARLGVKTATGDAEGEVVHRTDAAHVSRADLEAALTRFLGAHMQVPPMYSALKHEGQRLYQLARAGIEVERRPREVDIHELRLLTLDESEFEFEAACSKGTYIRTLVEDLAAAIGQCAYVTVLRRIGAAPFTEPQAITLGQLQAAAEVGNEALDALLLSPKAAVASLPTVRVDADSAFYLARGRAVRAEDLPDVPAIAVLDATGLLLGIARRNPEGLLQPSRWLVRTGD
jgi:tRNA pseudouridine55 synthase